MAIINQGILGAVSGRVGPVTTYVRNGKNILRTRRNSGVVKSTAARLAQREKIEICNAFTGALLARVFSILHFQYYISRLRKKKVLISSMFALVFFLFSFELSHTGTDMLAQKCNVRVFGVG